MVSRVLYSTATSYLPLAAVRQVRFPRGVQSEARYATLEQEARTGAPPPSRRQPSRPRPCGGRSGRSSERERALKPKDSFKESTIAAMIAVPAGSFVMGSPAGEPQRT